MTFHFREVTISGANEGFLGSTGVLNEITDAMTTAGWIIDDDRRSQAGASTLASTHKIVLRNDGGESGTSPQLYFTMTSGTSATQGQSTIGMQLHTAYDSGSHTVPASGLKSPDTTTLSLLRTFTVDPNGYNKLWIASDKEAIFFILNKEGNSTSASAAGRCEKFLDDDLEPYGAYLFTSTTASLTANGAVGFIGNNPVQNISDNINNGDFGVYTTLSTNNQPRAGLGNAEPFWVGLPVLWTADDASPLRKGAIGYVRHVFSAASRTTGIPDFGTAVVPETGQIFKVFGLTTSVLLRAS